MDSRSNRNDAFRDALGLTRAETCALVACVAAWVSLQKMVTQAEVNELVQRTDPSNIAFAGKCLTRLERMGLVTSKAPPSSIGRPYQPTRRALKLVLGWAGREQAA